MYFDIVLCKFMTIELHHLRWLGPQRHKLRADREYCDIVLSKFTTIEFFSICACLGLSDTSLWPTGSAMTSS